MNYIQLGQVTGLAHKFNVKYQTDILNAAIKLYQMATDMGISENHPDYQILARLAHRIVTEMTNIDEPRYSMHDYADGIANARQTLNLQKLLDLDNESFAAAMIWLATDKRETYEGRDHMQEPLELDVYMT